MTKQTTIVGALIAVALLAAYVTLTITDHDGNALLGALLGYLGGAGTPAAVAVAKQNGNGG